MSAFDNIKAQVSADTEKPLKPQKRRSSTAHGNSSTPVKSSRITTTSNGNRSLRKLRANPAAPNVVPKPNKQRLSSSALQDGQSLQNKLAVKSKIASDDIRSESPVQLFTALHPEIIFAVNRDKYHFRQGDCCHIVHTETDFIQYLSVIHQLSNWVFLIYRAPFIPLLKRFTEAEYSIRSDAVNHCDVMETQARIHLNNLFKKATAEPVESSITLQVFFERLELYVKRMMTCDMKRDLMLYCCDYLRRIRVRKVDDQRPLFISFVEINQHLSEMLNCLLKASENAKKVQDGQSLQNKLAVKSKIASDDIRSESPVQLFTALHPEIIFAVNRDKYHFRQGDCCHIVHTETDFIQYLSVIHQLSNWVFLIYRAPFIPLLKRFTEAEYSIRSDAVNHCDVMETQARIHLNNLFKKATAEPVESSITLQVFFERLELYVKRMMTCDMKRDLMLYCCDYLRRIRVRKVDDQRPLFISFVEINQHLSEMLNCLLKASKNAKKV